MRALLAPAAAMGALATPSMAQAELMGGLGYPDTILDGLQQSHDMACFLAVSGRPVAGFNLDAPKLVPEGVETNAKAPVWLQSNYDIAEDSKVLKLDTGEGDLWIVFNAKRRTCLSAAKVDDFAATKASFEAKAYGGKVMEWKQKKDRSATGYHFRMKLSGIKYTSWFPASAASEDHFLVEIAAKR